MSLISLGLSLNAQISFTLSKGMQRSGFAVVNLKAGADSLLVSEWETGFFGFGYSLHFSKIYAFCSFGNFAQTQFEEFHCLSGVSEC